MSSGQHHTYVVKCPREGHQSAVLNLIGRYRNNSAVAFSRSHLPVSEFTFAKKVASALCMQMNSPQGDLLRPWVNYHLGVGFQHILVYAETENTTWAQLLLSDFVQDGRVTIVPFYFDKSLSHSFKMQGSMEQHCLYQAKGRVKWLGHADVDEYFEFMGKYRSINNVSKVIEEIVSPRDWENVSVITVASQFWTNQSATRKKLVFPCDIICKCPGYYGQSGGASRAKNFINPDNTRALFPHSIVPTGRTIHRDYADHFKPNPEQVVRLNHYKACSPAGCKFDPSGGCDSSICVPDLRFRKSCSALV